MLIRLAVQPVDDDAARKVGRPRSFPSSLQVGSVPIAHQAHVTTIGIVSVQSHLVDDLGSFGKGFACLNSGVSGIF